MAVTQADLEKLYLAYFGRPADFDGLVYYTTGNWDIWQVAQGFSESPESQALYGPGFNAGVINNIYNNLFNRDAEPAGLLYWSQQVASGALSPAGAALGILLGAQNADLTTVNNKLAVATAFTNALDTAAEIIGYTGADAAAEARAFLHTVTADPATVTAALANLDAEIAAVVAVGGLIGDTISLTKNTDTLDFTDNITVIDTVNGIVDGANSTLSVGDTITGNGKTIVNVAVASTGSSDFTMIENVKAVNIIAATSAWVNLDANGWSGIGSVNLTQGVDGLNVWVDGLNAGASLSIANVTGTLSTTYTDNLWTEIKATGGSGSSISYVGGVVTGTVGVNAQDVGFSQSATADNVDITIGNITIAPGADGIATSDVFAWIENSEDLGGDITVGNVSLSGGFYDWLTISNTDHTTASDAVNTTVGNVVITGKAAGGWVGLDISQTSTGATGNVTVGDVTMTQSGKNGSMSVSVDNYSYGWTNGTAMTGSLAVGNVSLTGGSGVTMDVSISQYASSTGDATVGDLSINSIAVSVGAKNATSTGDADIWINNEAYVYGTGAATVGNVSIGGQLYEVAQSSSGSITIESYARSAGGVATVGNVGIGDQIIKLATDAYFSYEVSITATAGSGTADVGAVSIGGLNATVGIGATLTYDVSISAVATGSASVGAVNVGAVTATADDGGEIDMEVSVWSSGDVDQVTFGSESYTLGVQATVSVDIDVSGSGDVAGVTFGNVTGTANKLGGFFSASHNVWAGGTLGDVSMGNVTLSAGKTADAWAYLYAQGTDAVGNVTVGDVSVTAAGATASGWFSVTANAGAGGTAGNLTIGNVTLSSTAGANVSAGMLAGLYGATGTTGGTLTTGNIAITVGESAKTAGGWAGIDLTNDLGAVKVGNITLTASGARTTADTTMAYDADITITAATSITVGNIAVVGSSGAGANNFATFTNILTLNAGTTKTIGTVDYSAFTSKATIDVSGFKGAGTVIGGTKADVITDNSGVNTLTGGAGGDTFTLVSTNKGLTAATVDTISDFSLSGGDKIDVALNSALDPNVNYGENTYADFAAFVTGANAANKEVFVGQVGSDSYVAFDIDEDGTVDFMAKLTGVTLATIDVTAFI